MRSEHRKNQIWEEIRKKGRANYLRSRIKTGLIIGLAITVLRAGFEGQLTFQYLTTSEFLLSLFSALITFPLVFYLMGIWLWNRNEKTFGEDNRENED